MNYDAVSLKYQHVFIPTTVINQELVDELLEAEIRFDLMEGEIVSADSLRLGCGTIQILVG
jgi:hypothetical protein